MLTLLFMMIKEKNSSM